MTYVLSDSNRKSIEIPKRGRAKCIIIAYKYTLWLAYGYLVAVLLVCSKTTVACPAVIISLWRAAGNV